MTDKMTVNTLWGGYEVLSETGQRFVVWKNGKCTCGKPKCEHYKAVDAYIKAGGRKAKGYAKFTAPLEGSMRCTPQPPLTLPQHPNHNMPIAERGTLLEAKHKNIVVSELPDRTRYFYELANVGSTQADQEAFMVKWGLDYKLVNPKSEQLPLI